MEIIHSIKEPPLEVCPKCNACGLERLVSMPGGFVVKGKQANQYPECKFAKHWRDKDGNLHKVTPSDGHAKSPTVSSKRKRSDEEVSQIKKQAAQKRKQQRRIRP